MLVVRPNDMLIDEPMNETECLRIDFSEELTSLLEEFDEGERREAISYLRGRLEQAADHMRFVIKREIRGMRDCVEEAANGN